MVVGDAILISVSYHIFHCLFACFSSSFFLNFERTEQDSRAFYINVRLNCGIIIATLLAILNVNSQKQTDLGLYVSPSISFFLQLFRLSSEYI